MFCSWLQAREVFRLVVSEFNERGLLQEGKGLNNAEKHVLRKYKRSAVEWLKMFRNKIEVHVLHAF